MDDLRIVTAGPTGRGADLLLVHAVLGEVPCAVQPHRCRVRPRHPGARAHRKRPSRRDHRPRRRRRAAEAGAAVPRRPGRRGDQAGEDQAAAVRCLLTFGARVETLVGPAGTGKSLVVDALAKPGPTLPSRGGPVGVGVRAGHRPGRHRHPVRRRPPGSQPPAVRDDPAQGGDGHTVHTTPSPCSQRSSTSPPPPAPPQRRHRDRVRRRCAGHGGPRGSCSPMPRTSRRSNAPASVHLGRGQPV
jgi:AAA domain